MATINIAPAAPTPEIQHRARHGLMSSCEAVPGAGLAPLRRGQRQARGHRQQPNGDKCWNYKAKPGGNKTLRAGR